jgi:hypothetical protein
MQALRGWYGVVASAVALFSSSAVLALTPARDACDFSSASKVNFTDADSSVGKVDNYDPLLGTTCPGPGSFDLSGLGPDVTYHIVPPLNTLVQVSMTPVIGDLALYVVSPTCIDGMFAMNCIVGDDNNGPGFAEEVSFTGVAGTSYYIVVDGYNGAADAFTLAVDGLLSPLDIDGDGEIEPLTDGLLTLRYDFGFTGGVLVNGAIDLANCTRCVALDVERYLDVLRESF